MSYPANPISFLCGDHWLSWSHPKRATAKIDAIKFADGMIFDHGRGWVSGNPPQSASGGGIGGRSVGGNNGAGLIFNCPKCKGHHRDDVTNCDDPVLVTEKRLRESVTKVNERVNALRSELLGKIERLNEHTANLERRVEILEREVGHMGNMLAARATEEEGASFSSRLLEAERKLTWFETTIHGHQIVERLDAIEKWMRSTP